MSGIRTVGWVAGTTVGLAVAGFVFHFPGSFGEPFWSVGAVVFGALLGAISGAAVGLCQWIGLGFPRRRLMALMAAMAIGIAVSHGLADGAPLSIGLPVVALIGAIGVTAGYAWLLGVRVPPMLVASILGWTGGWLLADFLTNLWRMPWTQAPVGWAQEHAVVGIVVGLVWGTATALSGMAARIAHGPELGADATSPAPSAGPTAAVP